MAADVIRILSSVIIGLILGLGLAVPLRFVLLRILRSRMRLFFVSFIVRRPSLLDGAAQIFAFGNPVHTYNFDPAIDLPALSLDAVAVALDMQAATGQIAREAALQQAQSGIRHTPLRPVSAEY